MTERYAEQRTTEDLEQTLKDLIPGTDGLFGLGCDKGLCNHDTQYPLFNETGKRIGYYRTSIMMDAEFFGKVVEVSDDRIKIRPDGVENAFLDLPFNRTGKDMAYLQSYELETKEKNS